MPKPIDCDECGGSGRLAYDSRDGEREVVCEVCGGRGTVDAPVQPARASVRDTMPCPAPAGCEVSP